MKKNGFFTFCFAFIPGAGQMYLGQMKRGVSLMILLGVFIALSTFIGSPVFALPIPIIFAYSFFDTWNIRNIDKEKKETYVDDYIWKNFEIETAFGKKLFAKRNLVLGIVLLIVGIYMLGDTVVLNIAYGYNIIWLERLMETILRYIPTILVAITSVVIGYKLIVGKKVNENEIK